MADCSAWLAEHSIPEAPYGSPQSEAFPLPPEASRVSSIIRHLVEACSPFGSALLQFTDWPLYKPDEMAVVAALRAAHGEKGWLIHTPGHVFTSEEGVLLAGMFSLAVFYEWDAYLYFDHHTILYCWEGEILDLWVPDAERLRMAYEVFTGHGLSSKFTGDA